MQGLKGVIAAATILGVAAAVGACGQKKVTHKPMKLGSVDIVAEQVVRV